MRNAIFRTCSSLAVAAVVATGCGDLPTAAAPRGPSLNTGVALSATVNCVPTYGYPYGSTYDCTAQASGGSGGGYSFAWYGSASEYYDQGGTSKAYVPCYRYSSSGYYSSGYLSGYGSVTDGDGNSASFSVTRSC